MWEPNEQLLLRAPVRYKKHEGTLFVTPRRVAWQQQGLPQLNPSIHYGEIGSLAQTPESSAKVLLKITATAPTPKDYTFHFISPKALTEREAIKSQVTELLARARGLMATNTPVQTSSVSSSAPSPAPFTPPTTNSATTTTAAPTSNDAGTPHSIQSIASPLPVSSSSTSTPPPPPPASSSSTNAWRHEEFMARRQLLSTSRELHMLHMELVVTGKSVSEEDFWSSPYVKRIRQKLKKDAISREGRQKGKSSKMVELKPGQQEGSDVKYTLTSQIIHNIFTEFPSVKRAYDTNVPDKLSEQQFWKRFLASEFFHRSRTGGRAQLTPYDDIFDRCLQEEDDENSKAPEILDKIKRVIDLTATEEDHGECGNAPDYAMKPGENLQVLSLIRRFNRHSMRVLEIPSTKSKNEEKSVDDDIEKEIIISDLTDEPPPEKIVLDIQDTRRYFESQSGGQNKMQLQEEEGDKLLQSFKIHFQDWQPEMTKHVMKPKVADKVCHDLTMTIKRKTRHDLRSSVTDAKLPPPVQQKIQNYHSATNEILRHFWSSFDPYRPEKNVRMVEGLRKQQEKLKEVLTVVNSYQGDVNRCRQTLMPVMTAVDRALEAAKKRGMKRRILTTSLLFMNFDLLN
ncbi:hypothetical protein PHYBLDRAFT_61213 [Phycomyces blakesleeanus NRRL 1555(-)]|uniref:BSD domain-containing protein n=1 Tax=Phycomyces blakesleeanus (strain ATCC 8743b / DSM 1359 / FGSC 10004 / NBRC 33097 / NRRL 1555) TaxID=763407 RepID=A0A167N1D2_PHYB8|nr:hypothetical protein PHYBLDRAFT_61213 [Phycomyces blakesleeanus NRRL 1555(-)]OAD74734.1 hypothetical protein PHYBLDRAFT_61213 [Phycomyces blakesleeanus NRRL 1555(-)]|eukprot:XP_018292774.1 hypothetical protein PHYBLDRAFT_61213 [Phycomyces blakesleeanus NRRL 1555(-)]